MTIFTDKCMYLFNPTPKRTGCHTRSVSLQLDRGNLVLLANSSAQAETIPQGLEQAARGIRLFM